jgi:hypothetical protein
MNAVSRSAAGDRNSRKNRAVGFDGIGFRWDCGFGCACCRLPRCLNEPVAHTVLKDEIILAAADRPGCGL